MSKDTSANDNPVTLIGLGPMGQAMTRTLLDAGHPVTVWNRTASRADDLVAQGARRAATPAEAVAAAPLVLLSLTDYQAMYDILDAVADDVLAGKDLVNLSSDTPQRSREAAAWADKRAARFLTGGIMVPAPMVGTAAASVYYSGPEDAFRAHATTLGRIGTPRFVGEDPGLAQLYYQAQLDVFLTTLAGLAHATALVGTAGVTAADFVPQAIETILGVGAMLDAGSDTAGNFDTSTHPGELSTVTMMGATADHIVGASLAGAIDAELPRAVKSLYDRAMAAGHGTDNWTSIIEVIRSADG